MSKIKHLGAVIAAISLFIPFFTNAAITVTTSTVDTNTIRIHVIADSFTDLRSPASDCGGGAATWAFILHKEGTDYQSSNQVYSTAGSIDVTEDITLAADGSYGMGILYGGSAANWTSLYNVTSCGTSGVRPFAGPNLVYGTTTIPLPVIASSSIIPIEMSTTTDLMIGNFFSALFLIMFFVLFCSICYLIFRIIR